MVGYIHTRESTTLPTHLGAYTRMYTSHHGRRDWAMRTRVSLTMGEEADYAHQGSLTMGEEADYAQQDSLSP